jgi:Arc/MetJ family transcription regulator
MRTNVDIDDELIEQVKKEFNLKTKREAIHLALQEVLKMKKRRKLLGLRGNVKWEGNLNKMRENRF